MIIVTSVLGGLLHSCNEWFDVDSSTKIKQDKLFSDPEGYRTAVNGIYRLLAEPQLYGRELTWGMVSVLGQNYNANTLPDTYYALMNSGPESAQARALFDPVWTKGYNVIANCNNIITHTEGRDASFFEQGEVEKELILGEMYGIRAMMHLQIMQLFAPAPIQDDGQLHMPYVTTYPDHRPTHLKVPEVMDKIIADLTLASEKLAKNDTLYNSAGMLNVGARIGSSVSSALKGGAFFSTRATRMNYFAATALLARACLWKGDKENALAAALKVYRYYNYGNKDGSYNSARAWFSYSSLSTTTVKDINRKMPEDILLAFYNTNAYDWFLAQIGNNRNFTYKNIAQTFYQPGTSTSEAGDYRYSKLIETNNMSRRWIKPVLDNNPVTDATAIAVTNFQGPLLPVIRMSEMAHIICECDPTGWGVKALYNLRYHRAGLGTLSTVAADKVWDFAKNDILRENMSEGRTFFFFKRLGLPVFNGTSTVDMSDYFVIPAPDGEYAF